MKDFKNLTQKQKDLVHKFILNLLNPISISEHDDWNSYLQKLPLSEDQKSTLYDLIDKALQNEFDNGVDRGIEIERYGDEI